MYLSMGVYGTSRKVSHTLVTRKQSLRFCWFWYINCITSPPNLVLEQRRSFSGPTGQAMRRETA